MNPEIKQETLHELVGNREIERKFIIERHTVEAILGVFAHRAAEIEQHYLDEFESEYELRVRSTDNESFTTCLKSKDEIERLELEVPISQEAFKAHVERSNASISKRRIDLGDGACLDIFEGAYKGQSVLEVEYPDRQTAENISFDKKQYGEFRIGESLQIKSNREIAEKARKFDMPEMLPIKNMSEFILGKIALERPSERKPYVIGLAGPSASGKTSLIERIKEIFGNGQVSSLCLDNYILGKHHLEKDYRQHWVNWDLPEVYDTQKAGEDLKLLLGGKAIKVPVFDFTRGEPKDEYYSETIKPAPVVVVEGLYALTDEIKPMLDRTIYLDGPIEKRIARRIERDVQRCRWTPEEIFKYMMEYAEPTHYAHVEQQKKDAEFVISS